MSHKSIHTLRIILSVAFFLTALAAAGSYDYALANSTDDGWGMGIFALLIGAAGVWATLEDINYKSNH